MNNSFSRYIIGDQILFKHAKGTGAIKGREFHEYHEILLFIDGELEFFSDGIRAEIKKNQLIIIPKQQYHQFHIKGNENNYHRCVFNFYDLPKFSTLINKCMNRLYITDASNEVKLLFNRAIAISEANLEEEEKKELLRSILLLVINELSTKGQNEELGEQYFENTLCMRCIEYINAHLCEQLSIKRLAKALNISQSLLSHTFTKEMHISPYRYVLQKRLILAHNRIANGESATTAAIECGFSDYSGFYKHYKKAFGIPPSKNDGYFNT